jgi:hypothetical protein
MDDTQNYWVLRLHPSSGILEARIHDVSDTGPASVLSNVIFFSFSNTER